LFQTLCFWWTWRPRL